MGLFGNLGLLLQASRAKGAIEKEIRMGWDWKVALKKAVVTMFKGAVAVLVTAMCSLSDSDVRAWLESSGVPPAAVPAVLLMVLGAIRFGGNWLKHATVLLLALSLAGPAVAQDPPTAPETDAVVIEIEAGAQAVLTRSARDDRAAARLTLDAPLAADLRGAIRLEASGLQAGGDLPFDPYNPRTFRAMQGIGEVRRQLPNGFAVGVAAGVTWSIEGVDGPRDPRLYTALALARVPLPGNGWARFGGGHHGPVGGWAAVGALSYPAGPGHLLVDYALPFARGADGAPLPWELKTMVSIPLKRWVIR